MQEEMGNNLNSNDIEYVDCDLCGSSWREAEVLPWFHYSTGHADLQLRRCQRCGLVYQSPRLSERGLASLYDRGYFESGHFGGKDKARCYFNPEEHLDISHFHRKTLDQIASFRPSPADLLEVGCAGGHFLLLAREQGYRVQGVEISAFAASEARNRYDLKVTAGTLEEAVFPDDSFDVIYLKDVFEHVRQPSLFLSECRRLLRSAGVLVIQVPNYIETQPMRFYIKIWQKYPRIRRVIWSGQRSYLLDKPFHIYEFSQQTLLALIKKAGFSVRRVDTYTLHPPFSIKQIRSPFGALRFLVRWFYFGMVSAGLIEGDRLDVYLDCP